MEIEWVEIEYERPAVPDMLTQRKQILQEVRQNPGRWAVFSRHASQNAAGGARRRFEFRYHDFVFRTQLVGDTYAVVVRVRTEPDLPLVPQENRAVVS